MNMYEHRRGSVRHRVWRLLRQRGWLGRGGNKMVGMVVLVLAALGALWLTLAMVGLAFGLVPWAIMGLITGWVAARLLGTRLGLGWMILAGIAGSWLGGAIFAGLLRIPLGGLFSLMHLVAAVIGAMVVIAITRAVVRPALPGPSRPRLARGA